MAAKLFCMERLYNHFLLIDATDRSKISCDQKRFFIALSLYPLSFFANTPFKLRVNDSQRYILNIYKIAMFRKNSRCICCYQLSQNAKFWTVSFVWANTVNRYPYSNWPPEFSVKVIVCCSCSRDNEGNYLYLTISEENVDIS